MALEMQYIDQPLKRSETIRWATRLDPNYTLRFGCKELHSVFFASKEDIDGLRTVVVALMPEAPEQLFVNAMELASQGQARVAFLCDKPGQAHSAARKAANMLPNHSRVSMERGLAGAWGGLQ